MRAVFALLIVFGLACSAAGIALPDGRSLTPSEGTCPSLCEMFCKYGNVMKTGCPICECKPNPCDIKKCGPGQTCTVVTPVCKKLPCDPIGVCVGDIECPLRKCLACKYGYEVDDNGCQTCTCRENPCNLIDCKPGQTCSVEQVQCIRAPCNPIGVCKPQCSPFTCMIHCEYGRVRDANGCVTCKCKHHPCAAMFCGPGTTCKVVQRQCVTQPCDPIGECQKIPDEPSCEFGSILPSVPNCGRGGERCPETHFCNIHPTDRYAVCCPRKRSPCDNHECRVGDKCVVEAIRCLVAPCPEKAVCKPLDVCELSSNTGHCRGSFPRYYHDATDGKCKIFIYGGCGGNSNNFRTLEECNRRCTCAPNCEMHCEFGYVRDKNGCDTCQCKPSPCAAKLCPKGTQCEVEKVLCKKAPCPQRAVCRPIIKNVCKLPKVTGPCKAYMPHYYFDSKTGKCTKFIYGGCGGNKNRFKTLWECQQRCECPGFACFAPPCKVNSCPAFPTATCRPSLCNCGADYFIGERQVDCKLENNQVGLECRPGTCGGVTDFQCVSHRECGGKKCSKGCCGSSCQPARHSGYCPQPRPFYYRCKFDSSKHCLGDHQCARDEKCCTHQDGCKYCDKAVDTPRRG